MGHLTPFRFCLYAVGLLVITNTTCAQYQLRLSEKVTLGYHPNIETYFIAEQLAVQHIDYMVFTRKDAAYAHQPLLTAAYAYFSQYVKSPRVRRIAKLIGAVRDRLHDNTQILQYLLSRKTFPAKGQNYPFTDTNIFAPSQNPGIYKLVEELADSLQSFYVSAKVGDFIQQNRWYYLGALQEVRKDLDAAIIPYMEAFYGERLAAYEIYIMPLMPITAGADHYRAFGPTIHTPRGTIATMVMSSSRMLPVKYKLAAYTSFGFDNPRVTKFLTVHELGHSFVNPHVNALDDLVMRDTALFTPRLRASLQPYYIEDWKNCVIEHLVRMGEIRVALLRKDKAAARRLRKMHIQKMNMVLIPVLEAKIAAYEAHRDQYPDFTSFLPELLRAFHTLKPKDVDLMVNANRQ
jgi:hypothetical protein